MGINHFGHHFRMSTFGESHGTSIGLIIEGCPAGIIWDQELLLYNLSRRRPGKHNQKKNINSDRNEKDIPILHSGIFEGKSLGTPIALSIENTDQKSSDYTHIKNHARPGHADHVWKSKYEHWDYRGGGRASGRETACRVMAGSIAQMLLKELSPETKSFAFVDRVFDQEVSNIYENFQTLKELEHPWSSIDSQVTRIPHGPTAKQVESLLIKAKDEGKSYGGSASLFISAPPAFIGEPIFYKLKNALSNAFMSIGAVCAVEMANGIAASYFEGSKYHDPVNKAPFKYAGINGGIATGEDIHFRIYFKPTASVLHTAKKGRHDPCIIPRAIPVLEAMANLVIADLLLLKKTNKINSLN